ncbi:MAG: O-antigen ligase family protein [Sporomusaceae bacterium]|nr:O-antigen ligase family protein [Sporomusaceae bacterium]
MESSYKYNPILEGLILLAVIIYCLAWGTFVKVPRQAMTIAALFALVGFIYQYYRYRISLFGKGKLKYYVFLLLGSYIFSCVFSLTPLHSLSEIRNIALPFLALLVVPIVVRHDMTRWVFLAATLSTLTVAVYTIYQGFHGIERASGFGTDHPYVLSHHFIFYSIIAGCYALRKETELWYRWLMGITVFLSIPALVFNGTRASWIVLVLLVLVVSGLFMRQRKKHIVKSVLVGFILLSFIAFIPSISLYFEERFSTLLDPHFVSNTERILMWKSALRIIHDYWLTGIGVENFYEVYNFHYISPLAREAGLHTHPHNMFLKSFAETGILGFSCLLLLFFYLIKHTFLLYRQTKNPFALSAFLLTLAYLFHGMVDYSMDQFNISSYYWFFVGIAIKETEKGANYAKYLGH